MKSIATVLALIVGLMTLSDTCLAQDLFIYPAKGQSQEQQDEDRYECHSWAVQQTGFDPSKAQAACAPATSQMTLSGAGDGVAFVFFGAFTGCQPG